MEVQREGAVQTGSGVRFAQVAIPRDEQGEVYKRRRESLSMRMLVLGAGQQGSACAFDLLQSTDHEIVLADIDVQSVAPFLEPHVGDRLTLLPLDAEDRGAVSEAVEGVTATMSAFPYYYNLAMASAAIEAGSHFCDLGGNTEIVIEQKKLHEKARERGVSLVSDCGLAPGMVNILAGEGIRRLDRTDEVHLKVGGLPQHPKPPLNYQVVYSLEGVIDYYTTLSWILRNGNLQQVKALSETESVDFPQVGTLEAFHTAGGLSLMAQKYEGEIERMEYKTLRYPGHAEKVETIRELGMFSTDPVQVRGAEVIPRNVFLATAGPILRVDPRESPDLVALRVEVKGEKDGRRITHRWDLLDRYDPKTGITAMMRTTGFSLSVTAQLQAAGAVEPGAWTPDEAIDAERYVAELARRGIHIHHSVDEEGTT